MSVKLISQRCSTCKKKKAVDQFHKDNSRKTGIFPICKPCRSRRMAEQYRKKQELEGKPQRRKRSQGQPYIFITGKTCTSCGVYKQSSLYYTHKRTIDGLNSHCKDCMRAKSRQKSRELK